MRNLVVVEKERERFHRGKRVERAPSKAKSLLTFLDRLSRVSMRKSGSSKFRVANPVVFWTTNSQQWQQRGSSIIYAHERTSARLAITQRAAPCVIATIDEREKDPDDFLSSLSLFLSLAFAAAAFRGTSGPFESENRFCHAYRGKNFPAVTVSERTSERTRANFSVKNVTRFDSPHIFI